MKIRQCRKRLLIKSTCFELPALVLAIHSLQYVVQCLKHVRRFRSSKLGPVATRRPDFPLASCVCTPTNNADRAFLASAVWGAWVQGRLSMAGCEES